MVRAEKACNSHSIRAIGKCDMARGIKEQVCQLFRTKIFKPSKNFNAAQDLQLLSPRLAKVYHTTTSKNVDFLLQEAS
jgi:hypothetical protein